MSDRAGKGKLRHFGYWECLRAARSSGSLPPLAVANEFDSRPYSHAVYDLAGVRRVKYVLRQGGK